MLIHGRERERRWKKKEKAYITRTLRVLHHVAACRSMLQCVAACLTVLQFVAAFCKPPAFPEDFGGEAVGRHGLPAIASFRRSYALYCKCAPIVYIQR